MPPRKHKKQTPRVIKTQPTPAVPLALARPTTIGLQPPRDWSSGIFGCCDDCKSCVLAFFFPWCYLSCCLSNRMGEHCCAPIITPSTTMAYRLKLRTKHNIQGNLIKDCCCSFWCCLCSICQIARELDYVELQIGGRAFPTDG